MPSAPLLAPAFAALQEERNRTWSTEALEANGTQRRALLDAFDPSHVVAVGDVVPDARLLLADGGEIHLRDLVTRGPAVLLLFRYASCPADNIALPIYDQALFSSLSALDVRLIAISPQVPERLKGIADRHKLRLTIASDPDNSFARALGLVFTPIATPEPPPAGWVGEITGTGTWELPQTSVLMVDSARIVRFVAVSPDWLDRVEPHVIAAPVERALSEPKEKAAA